MIAGLTFAACELRLIPREERFFDLFVEDAANVLGAARLFEAMLRTYDDARAAGPARSATPSTAATRSATRSAAGSSRRSSRPFDREDIHALISALDDVIDFIEESADTFILYRIEAPTAVAVQQASIIVKQCEQLHEALSNLRGFKGLEKYWIEVHRLENEGDQLARKAIAGLFSDGGTRSRSSSGRTSTRQLEAAIDKCEDVANIIERITIKHA